MTEREKFEAWAVSPESWCQGIERHGDSYKAVATAASWVAWQAGICSAVPSQPFPRRVLEVIKDVASRTPPPHHGVYEDNEGQMQDVADEALAWIAARELATPSQPEGAEPSWPKLMKPATVGAGTFGVGVSARLVVESAQRHYEWAQEERDNPKTPEQRRDAEMSRRRLWDMLNGVAAAGAAAPDEGQRWQPIETAPKDATDILACVRELVGPVVVYWNNLGNWVDGYSGERFTLTHWMPLPSAPKGEAATPSSQGGQHG